MQQGLLKQPMPAEEPPADPQADPQVQQSGQAPTQQQSPAQSPAPAQGEEAEDPALKTAVDFVKRALYETGSADGVHETMKASRQPMEDMAMLAYELTSIADEKTEGQVPDELLLTLAATVLSEVAEIAEASGVQLRPSDIAGALKIMTLRFAGEMGHDTRELQAAFDQVSPEQIDQLAAEEGNV